MCVLLWKVLNGDITLKLHFGGWFWSISSHVSHLIEFIILVPYICVIGHWLLVITSIPLTIWRYINQPSTWETWKPFIRELASTIPNLDWVSLLHQTQYCMPLSQPCLLIFPLPPLHRFSTKCNKIYPKYLYCHIT